MSKDEKEIHEITVRLTIDAKKAKEILEQNGYIYSNDFIVEDIYLVPEEFNDIYKYDERRLLNMSVRLRSFIFDPKTVHSIDSRNEIVKKDKNFDEENNILSETKYVCRIKDIDEAYNLLKSLGYVELFKIRQEAKTFVKENYEVTLSNINDRIYVEMENIDRNGKIVYDSPESMIKDFKSYNLPYVEGEYFVQKAVDMIKELKKRIKRKNK